LNDREKGFKMNQEQKINAAVEYINHQVKGQTSVDTGIVLGSGFLRFVEQLEIVKKIPLRDIPNFPCPSVEGHGAELILATFVGKSLWVLTGRIHLYEGYDAHDVVFAVRVMAKLGVQNLCVTNASGGLNLQLPPGSVVLIQDQINLQGQSSLSGKEVSNWGPSFVDMGSAFDKQWMEAIQEIDPMPMAVYAGVSGPAFETPAEAKMLRILGADVVGMSTVQEVMAAVHLKMKVVGVSFVTNWSGGTGDQANHLDVLQFVDQHQPKLVKALRAVLSTIQ
jgi:purine-nucleoside phosphorylase